MRVLCSCLPGFGHFHPMVPLGRALVEAGHQVAFATAERFCRRVVAPAGFTAFPAGASPLVVDEETMRLPEVAALGPDEVWALGAQMFARVAGPAKVADLVRVIGEWQADLVVHDAIDFGAPVAAAHQGIPWAGHSFGALQPDEFWARSAVLVAPTWQEWGVDPGPQAGMFRHLYLDICPPSFQAPHAAGLAARQLLRPVPFDTPGGESLPDWVASLPDRPTVYVTLGTIFNDTPGIFEAVLAGLRDGPYNLVVTVGHDRDPAELGPQPPNVHVERWVPQSLLFPHCDAVVSHAGSGTTLAALAHGLPHLMLPQGANQFWNAERTVALGAGLQLLADQLQPATVRQQVDELLDRPGYRAAAARLAAEIAAMPPPAAVVPVLERL